MQFPKTKLNDFFIDELCDYKLFNSVCNKSSQAILQTNSQSPHNQLISMGTLQRSRQIINDLNEILSLLSYVKTQNKILLNTQNQIHQLMKCVQIVEELLSNCEQGPTIILKELKKLYKYERPILAERTNQVNNKMLAFCYDYIQQDLIEDLLNQLKDSVHNNRSCTQLIQNLKIRGTQILMLNLIMPSAIDTDQDDLFSLDVNHMSWIKLNCITTRKILGDPQKIKQSFDQFAQSIELGHALVQCTSGYQNKVAKWLSITLGGFYYSMSKSAAQKIAQTHTSELSVESAYKVMNFIELPGVKHLINMGLPKIKTNKKFYINPVVMPLILNEINQELTDGTLNTITPMKVEYVNQEVNDDQRLLFVKDKSKLRIRLIYNNKIIEQENIFTYLKSFIVQQNKECICDRILIHIHGGGFIAQSSSSHQCYTREWAIKLGIPIFSIDYGLAPQYAYPIPLDDCWQAYHWILKYSEIVFNIRPQKIIVAGDSAGGNLATALIGLAIKYQQRVPDGLILNYPSVDIRFQFTPSYLKAVNDKVLSHTILGICIESYSANPESQLSTDPFMSPLLFSYEILKHFPPVRLFCGSEDPLYDQVFRLGHKLLQLQKDVQITIYENLTHGYLNYNTIKGMPEIAQCVQDNVDKIRELLN